MLLNEFSPRLSNHHATISPYKNDHKCDIHEESVQGKDSSFLPLPGHACGEAWKPSSVPFYSNFTESSSKPHCFEGKEVLWETDIPTMAATFLGTGPGPTLPQPVIQDSIGVKIRVLAVSTRQPDTQATFCALFCKNLTKNSVLT